MDSRGGVTLKPKDPDLRIFLKNFAYLIIYFGEEKLIYWKSGNGYTFCLLVNAKDGVLGDNFPFIHSDFSVAGSHNDS